MSDRLLPGQQLNVNDRLNSLNGKVTLVMQGDGNLVLYRTDIGSALWSTNTWGTPITHAILQTDGNFVCYDAAGRAYWASNTATGALPFMIVQHSVVLQDDGNLVIYDLMTGIALWTSNTFQFWGGDRLVANQQLNINDTRLSPNGRATLIMQGDGNLVIYRTGTGTALWASNTWGQPVTVTIMQGDGNLVSYDRSGKAYWSSNTWNHPGAYAVLLDDGTLVVYDYTSQVLWSSTPSVLVDTAPRCQSDRGSGAGVEVHTNDAFRNWPQNIAFNAAMYFRPKTRAELVNAVLSAERAGHHVRAAGSTWSFSDASVPTDASRLIPGALIDMTQLAADLQTGLPALLAPGVDPTFLIHAEAGITITDLNFLLDHQPGRQTLDSGGGSGQTLGGVLSTSTHGGDSLVPPLADYVCAMHLVGAGGAEYWIEPNPGITSVAQLQAAYPCLAAGNIRYDNDLFHAVLCAGGSMGVIYSVILKTVPQFGLVQHRFATTWEMLLGAAGANLSGVLDGTFLSTTPGMVNILDGTRTGAPLGPYAGNRFSQVVINPYPLEANDGTLSAPEIAAAGQHLCFVTNRVPVPIPVAPSNPGGSDIGSLDVMQIGQAARNSLGSNILDYDIRFKNFLDSIKNIPDLSTKAALLVNFLADNFDQRTISAVVTSVLTQIMPVGERLDISYKLADVLSWGASIKSLSVEAAFSVPNALAFVSKVLALVASYAAMSPRIYVGGYLSLRFVGKKTAALLGMQQWSPTCCVEYAMLAGSNGISNFVADLQKLVLSSQGALHWGQCNDVMTASDLANIHGAANVQKFQQARAALSANGFLTTFNNSFTDRLGLSV